MASKTTDIEEFVAHTLRDGPKDQDALVAAFRQVSGEELTWLGIAVHRMLNDKRITAPNCAPNHNHEGDCVLALTQK